MKLDSIPNIDPMFQNDLDAKLMLIVQRIFFMGILVGKNQVADDADAAAQPLNAAVQSLMQELGKLMPNIQSAAPLAANLPEMSKSERKSTKRYSVLDANNKRTEDLHDLTVKKTLEDFELHKNELAAKIVKEVARNKPKSK